MKDKYTLKLITINGHVMSELANATHNVEDYRKLSQGDCVALEPDSRATRYILNKINSGSQNWQIEKAGHDIMVARYAFAQGLNLFCLTRSNTLRDIENISRTMQKEGLRSLMGIVEEKDKNYFARRFEQNGFSLSL